MGRPPIGRMVNVRFPAALLAELDATAKDLGMTRAKALREAARRLVDAVELDRLIDEEEEWLARQRGGGQ